jgi:hypothetical protein
MQSSNGSTEPEPSTLAYVSEAFYDASDDLGVVRTRKLVCSSSNDGGLTWSRPRSVPPFLRLQSIVEPSRPSVVFWGGGRALLAFVGNLGRSSARVVMTDAGLPDLRGDCRFRAPVAELFEMDEMRARALSRVKLAANQTIGPVLAIEYKTRLSGVTSDENDAACRFELDQVLFTRIGGSDGYRPRPILSVEAPCRNTIPGNPGLLNLSHFDVAVDEPVTISVPRVDTRVTATNIHLVTIHDPDATDGVDRSEVVYRRVRTSGTGANQTHVLDAPQVLSNAAATQEIVFQPTVSAVALPFAATLGETDVFVTWYQMNANGQARLLGRRRNAATGQWGVVQVLHTSLPNRTESICTTDFPDDPRWSFYSGSVAMIDGWPARGSLSDPELRFDAFPLAVTLFTSSRTRGCRDQSANSALFQELHATRWR